MSLPRPESIIYETDSAVNRKKRSIDISSSETKLPQDKAFTSSEKKGCDTQIVPPSKKMKV